MQSLRDHKIVARVESNISVLGILLLRHYEPSNAGIQRAVRRYKENS